MIGVEVGWVRLFLVVLVGNLRVEEFDAPDGQSCHVGLSAKVCRDCLSAGTAFLMLQLLVH